MKKGYLFRLCLMGGLCLIGGLIGGCGGVSSGSGSASVRGVNAIPNLASATITVGAAIVMEGGSYGSSTSYQSVSSNVAEQIMLGDANNNGATLATATDTVTGGDAYTAYAVGSYASPSILLLSEDHSTPPTGDIRMNFVNLSPTIQNVDVYVTATTVTSLSGLTPNVSSLAYQSAEPFVVAAGAYTVSFTVSGSQKVIASYTTSSLSAGTLTRYLLLDPASGGVGQTVSSLLD